MENRKFGLWLVVGILLMLSGCSEGNGSGADGGSDLLKEAFPWLKGTGRTEDMTPVEIELVDERSGESLRFRIPKAYLTDTVNWAGGQQDQIKIETGLPDLEPRPGNIWITEKPGTSEHERKIRFFRNGLFVRVKARSGYKSPKAAAGARKAYPRDHEKQSEKVYGLEFYKSVACTDIKRTESGEIVKTEERCWERSHEFFLTPIDFDGPWAAFRCTRLEVDAGGGCIVRASYRGMALQYIFRRNQFHRWREFDAGVRELLSRFVIQPNEAETDSQG